MPVVLLLIVVLVVVIIAVVSRRRNELFVISVRGGKTLVVRGRVVVRLHQDIVEVISSAGVTRATIRAVCTETHATIRASGVDEACAQRLRNVFGLYSVSRLRSAPAPKPRRNLGQILGWTWLAWLLLKRD